MIDDVTFNKRFVGSGLPCSAGVVIGGLWLMGRIDCIQLKREWRRRRGVLLSRREAFR